MLCASLSSGINLLRCLILRFKFLLEIFVHQSHDPPTVLVGGALPIVYTTMTKSRRAEPVVLLAALGIGRLIGQLVLLGTKVPIFLRVVAKIALAKRLLLLMQSLAL